MAHSTNLLCLVLMAATLVQTQAQAYIGNTAFDALDGLGCSQFKAIIMEAQLEETFRSPQALTLFVFNDTAYALMPPYRLGTLYDKTNGNNLGAKEYVNSFTLTEAVETSAFSDANPITTYSVRNRKVFLNKRDLRSGNVASGTPGPTKYFCNGGMLIRPNIQAGQHLIHIIDQVLDMPLEDNALAYVSGYNPSKLTFLQRSICASQIPVLHQDYGGSEKDGDYNYNQQVQKILAGKQVTFFIPSDEALNLIPSQKLSELQGNTRLMLEIITLHIIPNQVLYTSLVNHNERFNTQFNSGAVVFRKVREDVYVTGALKGGRTVTAKLNPGNRTVLNGVVHQIDAMLGFVYKTAIEEIQNDPNTQNFEQLIFAARKDLQNYITATSGVVVFVPTNQAMYAIANVYQNYINNQSLVNMVLEMSLLQQGQSINLMDYNGGYEAYKTAVSRYNGRLIKLYSEGSDTWVEGGYVKARVIKPNIGVTNGVVHQIDAVFGIPTRDIPYTVFCEDWLVSTYIQLKYVGLDAYMRDPTLTRNQDCVFSASAAAGQVPPAAGTWQTNTGQAHQNQNFYGDLCGDGLHRCEFTFFVPNHAEAT
ncbi:fasciclin-1-like [Physella acuta]|uniref:fasciclin-1-like n=1 Tax=Physella acuta TaxID=109671 RepID=UPI0027DB814C|nr:fasciclin-1-like [Physella acuta]